MDSNKHNLRAIANILNNGYKPYIKLTKFYGSSYNHKPVRVLDLSTRESRIKLLEREHEREYITKFEALPVITGNCKYVYYYKKVSRSLSCDFIGIVDNLDTGNGSDKHDAIGIIRCRIRLDDLRQRYDKCKEIVDIKTNCPIFVEHGFEVPDDLIIPFIREITNLKIDSMSTDRLRISANLQLVISALERLGRRLPLLEFDWGCRKHIGTSTLTQDQISEIIRQTEDCFRK